MANIFAKVRGRTLKVQLGTFGNGEKNIWDSLAEWDDANGTDIVDVLDINSNGISFVTDCPVDDVIRDRESFERYVESRGRNDAPLFLGLDGSMESAVASVVRTGDIVEYHDSDHVDLDKGELPYVVIESGELFWNIEVLKDLAWPWDRGEILSWACGIEILPRCARRMKPNTE